MSMVGQDMVSMNLDNKYNMGYVGEFFLGSETPQKIRVMFDTGSANSWVLSSEVAQNMDAEKREKHFFYDPESSPTFEEPEYKQWVKINFGSGSLRGYFVHDQCTIGDMTDDKNQLVLESYMFGLVVEDSTFTGDFDAIVGLAYPQFAEPGVEPFFDGLMRAGIMGKDVFAFFMSMNPDEEDSELMLGDWDEARFSGDLKWYPVVH